MKSIRSIFTGLLILGGFLAMLNLLSAQEAALPVQAGAVSLADTNTDWDSLSDLEVELKAVEMTTPTAAADVPPVGTFWSAQHAPGSPAAWPPFPSSSGLAAWSLGDGVFLLDDLAKIYQTPVTRSLAAGGMSALTASLPAPADGSGTDLVTADTLVPDYGTNLWLAQTVVAAGQWTAIGSNTLADVPYEIQSLTSLAQTNWFSEGFIYGSETTNWTPLSVAQGNRTNLFLRLRSWADDGSSLPIWWQLQNFGYVGVDPYGDPMGDGWNNLQKFQNGWNPNVFHTPPAPPGLTVQYVPSTSTATLTWQPAPGPVTGYVVLGSDGSPVNLPAGSTSVQISVPDIPNGGDGNPTVYESFQVQAQYAGGNSALSAPAPLMPDTVAGSFAFGAGTSIYLNLSALPANAATVRLIQTEVDASLAGDDSLNATYEIPVALFINGRFLLPTNWLPPIQAAQAAYGYADFDWWLQTSNTDGSVSAGALAWSYFSSVAGDTVATPYFDGRAQLKQNLVYLLRTGLDIPLTVFGVNPGGNFSGREYAAPTNNYAQAGFYDDSGSYFFAQFNALYGSPQGFNEYLPFEQNYFYRNFVFNLADTDANGLLASCDTLDTLNASYYNVFGLQDPPPYLFQPPAASGGSLGSVLATNDTRWLFMALPDVTDAQGNSPIGMISSGGTNYLATGFRNQFGLPFLSTLIAWGNSGSATALSYPGQATTAGGWYYSETAQPQFQTVEYDFFNPNWVWNGVTQTLMPPAMPGEPGFATTNQSQLFIVSPGVATQIAGYAKLAVLNGYPGVYGYLGQYFDQAYQITNGSVTTNTTGFLSPYGNFFPTQPGPTALVTMPDLDTGERGTATVYAVSLVLDKNHDGTMDTSFSGADATSQANPMVFWVNNGHDEPGQNGNLDFDRQVPPATTNYSAGAITCQRDLENFARLWVCGVPPLPLYQNYTFTLSLSPASGNPAINLYQAVETNGGTGYLTDTNIAAQQAATAGAYAAGVKLGTISNNSPLTIPGIAFTFGDTQHYLFEGAGIGAGELLLTITDSNGNQIAQTGVWLDLHDIKDFYERAVITDNTSGAISNWTSGIETVQQATTSTLGDDTNLIVFVHGINVGNWDWLNDSDTVLKRLYWAGYQGKFATVDWPCNLINYLTFLTLDIDDFNNSELKAYKASTSLAAYLNQLRSRFPGYRLNLYAHSQGNPVVSEAIEQGAPFDTYILTQGALPASCYDVNATNDPTLIGQESYFKTPEWQPMGYHGVYTNFTGRIVNFYNSQDLVLKYWYDAQEYFKPSISYSYNGTNSTYTGVFSSYTVTDPQESRANVSRSRTLAIGQEGANGSISATVDLNARFGFNGSSTDEHSAQWTRPIQTCLPYYTEILTEIKPAP